MSTILVNIFGGIMRCDDIALGIIKAASMLGIRKKIDCHPPVLLTRAPSPDECACVLGNSEDR